MSAALWLLSFVYLALVVGFVTAAARDGAPFVDEADAPSLGRRAASFAAMILVVTATFGLLIGGIEWIF